jgi:hypothetical protein
LTVVGDVVDVGVDVERAVCGCEAIEADRRQTIEQDLTVRSVTNDV